MTALRVALKQVGYDRHYYWDTQARNGRGDPAKWIRLLSRKFDGSSGLIPKSDLDAILGDYTSLADFPCALFAEDLIAAYPDAKVILSVRDSPEAWYRSFDDTVWRYQRRKIYPQGLSERFWAVVTKTTNLARVMTLIIHNTPLREFPTQGRQWYLDHNEKIRKLVPQDRLLVFNAKEGWGPLCEFLGVKQPEGPYPTTNNTQNFQRMVDRHWVTWQARKTQSWLQMLSIAMLGTTVILFLLDIKDRAWYSNRLAWSGISILKQ